MKDIVAVLALVAVASLVTVVIVFPHPGTQPDPQLTPADYRSLAAEMDEMLVELRAVDCDGKLIERVEAGRDWYLERAAVPTK